MHPIAGKVFTKYKTILNIVEGKTYELPDFISIAHLERLISDDLTIHCDFEQIVQDFDAFKPLLNSKKFSDIEFRVPGETFAAHKLVLSLSSNFFREKLENENYISYIEYHNGDPKVAYEMLRFMYTGKVNNLEIQEFATLLKSGEIYGINGLRAECEKKLIANFKVENVISAILLHPYDDSDFGDMVFPHECYVFIKDHFKEIIYLGVCKDLIKREPRYLRDILNFICEGLNVSKCKKISNISPTYSQIPGCFSRRCDAFLNNKTSSDIEIHVGDKIFYGHTEVLATRSRFFKRMFERRLQMTIPDVAEIKDIESEVFCEVLRFIYTNKVEKIDIIAKEILIAANKYEIDDLKLLCEDMIEAKLTREDVRRTIAFADDHNLMRLKDKCLKFIVEKFCLYGNWIFRPAGRRLTDYLLNHRPHLLLEVLNKLASDYELDLSAELF
ncbi:uncharacterized protein LOC117173401 [Belonocnema kinseyi]|uniref:uncharacterized protein LOC117173401 n=1 Tax=Belonocnema kinseyi TaxID=2817044 RepID=UPI00143CE93D|nr:uncharacterized protein LOC117173401 [Belonocnema kinseyi]